MGKVVRMKNIGKQQSEQSNNISTEQTAYQEIQKQIVLGILEKGEKPNRGSITQQFEQQLQQYNIAPSETYNIWKDISTIFPEKLSDADIQLFANMYADIRSDEFMDPQFDVNFNETHDNDQQLFNHTFDAITTLLDHKTVSELATGTRQDLLHTFSQEPKVSSRIKRKATTHHPVETSYIRKQWGRDWHRMAA